LEQRVPPVYAETGLPGIAVHFTS
ncbi:MAG: hypothetical protein RI939_1354, partial [Actinomycetota bacterium]